MTSVVDTAEIVAAAHALATAGRWAAAARLLDAAGPDPADAGLLALAAAEVALESDWFAGTDLAPARLAAPELGAADPWRLGFARLRHAYRGMFVADRDPDRIAMLRRDAERLEGQARDAVERGWAAFYRGVIADNLAGRRDEAPAHYRAALGTGDDLLEREALRHLGDHDHDDGDHAGALKRWREATAIGARAGAVPGTLSQQLLLAVLARDEGDEAGAAAIAAEVARWAGAIGASRLAGQAEAFLDGVDPTAPPPMTNRDGSADATDGDG